MVIRISYTLIVFHTYSIMSTVLLSIEYIYSNLFSNLHKNMKILFHKCLYIIVHSELCGMMKSALGQLLIIGCTCSTANYAPSLLSSLYSSVQCRTCWMLCELLAAEISQLFCIEADRPTQWTKGEAIYQCWTLS